MRHGVLASIGVLTLICLAAGDEAREWRPDKDQAVCFPQIKERNDKVRPVRRLPERSDKLAEMDRCVEHIRIAAKHLKTAGMHDFAHNLVGRAEGMEREVSLVKKRRAKELEELRRQLHKRELQLEEIRREHNRMQQRLEELERQDSKSKELCPLIYKDYLAP